MITKNPPVSTPADAYSLIDAIIATIRDEPARLRMNNVIVKYGINTYVEHGVHAAVPSCGTMGCVAGWAMVLTRHLLTLSNIEEASHVLFGASPHYMRVGVASESLEQQFAKDIYTLFYLTDPYTMSGTQEYAEEVIRHIISFRNKWERRLKAHDLTYLVRYKYEQRESGQERTARQSASESRQSLCTV